MGPTFRPPEGHTEFGYVYALLLGLNGRVYSASKDTPIRVWLGDDGAHIQTLEGHTDGVTVAVWIVILLTFAASTVTAYIRTVSVSYYKLERL
jgi:WD40 repeat protein